MSKKKQAPVAIEPPQPEPASAPLASAPEPAQHVAAPPVPLTRIEQARELPEASKDDPAAIVQAGIQAFKDADRRTMHVVVVYGRLYKQAA